MSHNIMSVDDANRLGLELKKVCLIDFELGCSSKNRLLGEAQAILNIDRFMSKERILVISMKQESGLPILIMGRTWLREHNLQILG